MAFIGMQEDYDKYKESDSYKEKERTEMSEVNRIAYDNMEPISDEDLLILQQSRTRHDPYSVFMHSDLEFYDNFYNLEVGNSEDDELLKEVRGIRRLYKNIPDYLYATHIRDLYINRLVEKYGGEEMYTLYLGAGQIKDWVPPIPLLSKHAEGYDLFKQGIIDYTVNEYNDEAMNEIVDKFAEEIDLEDMKVIGGVETRRYALMMGRLVDPDNSDKIVRYGGNNAAIGGVTVSDLQGLQKMFRSWYRDDEEENNAEENKEYFSRTENAIRAEYYSRCPDSSNGDLRRILNSDTPIDFTEEEDLDEMVIDSETQLPMTRGELRKRQFIRHLASLGWNDVRLMRAMDVGSEYELKILNEKRRRNKKSKKKAASFMNSIAGEDIMNVNTIDELDKLLFDS